MVQKKFCTVSSAASNLKMIYVPETVVPMTFVETTFFDVIFVQMTHIHMSFKKSRSICKYV